MQNCLQKKKRKIKLSKVLLTALFALAAVFILAFGNAFKYLKNYNGAARADYTGTLFESLDEKQAETKEIGVEMNLKMNNFELKNAKMVYSPANLTGNDVQSCKNVDVLMSDGRVETLGLEEYVAGCVLGEMPLDFESQALMAQSVAVRTFTVRQMLCGTSKHKNADVCTDSACCQSYADAEYLNLGDDRRKKLSDAVNATSGVIMVYEGEPIEAVYHASSGERTLSSEDVWGGRREYLRSVPSPEGEAEMAGVLYGHRVGMSQHGANILAQSGLGYARILRYYYSGISFSLVT